MLYTLELLQQWRWWVLVGAIYTRHRLEDRDCVAVAMFASCGITPILTEAVCGSMACGLVLDSSEYSLCSPRKYMCCVPPFFPDAQSAGRPCMPKSTPSLRPKDKTQDTPAQPQTHFLGPPLFSFALSLLSCLLMRSFLSVRFSCLASPGTPSLLSFLSSTSTNQSFSPSLFLPL